MEKRYYAGLELEKDLELCRLYDKIKSDTRFEIINHGRNVEVVEMKYINNYSSDREETGKIHIGFDFHFITVKYKDYIVNIEPATYYPFTDENDPGKINAIFYKIVGDNKKHQCSYSYKIENPDDIVKQINLNEKYWQCFKDTYDQNIKF